MAFPWEAVLAAGGKLGSTVVEPGLLKTLLAAGGEFGTSLLGQSAVDKASQAEIDAAQRTAQAFTSQAGRTTADLEPWRKAGINALQWLENANIPGQMSGDQIAQHITSLPGYRFAEEELDKTIDRRHAASGDRFSGRGMKEAVRWKDRYLLQPAFQNWLGQIGQQAGYGPAATQRQGTIGSNAVGNVGRMDLLGAQNVGQQAIGRADMYSSALQNIMQAVNESMR